MTVDKHYLLAFLLIIHSPHCACLDTITINQTFKDGDLLISQGNNFALGFFSPGNSKYRYVGIWYHKVPLRTVVWVANRNNPINASSGVLSITQDGNLTLYSNLERKTSVWSANVSVQARNIGCVARLLDSGNLVLMEGSSKRVFWQSFDFPTDTLLPGMKFGLDLKTGLRRYLTSWRSPDDPGIGEYSVQLNPSSGFPQVFLYRSRIPIWRAILWPLDILKDIRNFSLINNQDEISVSYFISDPTVILMSVLDHSGVQKHIRWHAAEGKWKEMWTAEKFQCGTYKHCGVHSKCNPTVAARIFECECLPGFEPKNPRDWNIFRDGSGGCIRKRKESYKTCSRGEGFLKVEHVKVPDTSSAIWVERWNKEWECEDKCKRNCSCTAYVSINFEEKGIVGCFMWFGELMDTVDRVYFAGSDLYVRVDALELASSRKSNRYLGNRNMVFIFVLSAASAWVMIVLLACFLFKRKRKRVNDKWKKRILETFGSSLDGVSGNEATDIRSHLDITFFDLITIIDATNGFSATNKLGHGGFGSVYKGQQADGQEIAVKRLGESSRQGMEEFKNEVILIGKLQHKNLVKLLGCCIEGDESMLIYEYLSNKSLDLLLFDEAKRFILSWRKRVDIIVGIARGVLYLHQDSRLRIIHRDLKTSNILLDDEFNPKISDFGMARLFKGEQIKDRTNRVVGTFGYMPPEYVVFGKFSIKSDVFSFGVILLEIISGKKNNNFYPEGSSLSLIGCVWELWKEKRARDIIDSSVEESYDMEEALRCIQIGLLCVEEDEADRPTMFNVILMLNSEIPLPFPKQPAFAISNTPIVLEQVCSINDMTITTIVSR